MFFVKRNPKLLFPNISCKFSNKEKETENVVYYVISLQCRETAGNRYICNVEINHDSPDLFSPEVLKPQRIGQM